MIVGVKYCGGCNPHYERGDAVAAMAAALPEHTFLPVQQAERADVILVVHGCPRACASLAGLKAPGGVIQIQSERDGKDFLQWVKQQRT